MGVGHFMVPPGDGGRDGGKGVACTGRVEGHARVAGAMEHARSLPELQAEHGSPPPRRGAEPPGEARERSGLRNYVRDLILGYNDGLVSVYAVTAGVAGAAFSTRAILVAGTAAAVAGALSMAAGEFVSTKSQREYYAAERRREAEHLRMWPDLERRELRESLEAKGLRGEVLEAATQAIASDRERFLAFMMQDEFGVGPGTDRSPWRASVVVVLAFLLGALVALVPFAVWTGREAVVASSLASVAGLFTAGALRARASRLPMLKAGLEMVGIGVLAAALTFGAGLLFGV